MEESRIEEQNNNKEQTKTEDAVCRADKKKGKENKNRSGLIKGIAIGAAGVLVLECIAGRLLLGGSEELNLLSIDSKIKEIETLIDYSYLYDADKQNMEDGLFMGMLYGLTDDRYSAYYSKSVYAEEKKRLEGNYVGIGVTVSKDTETGGILVNAVNASGPAAREGVKAGDIIIKADGIDLTQKDTDYAVSIITGKEGTTVTITVLRDGNELEFTIERENITTISVQSNYIDEAQALTSLDTGERNIVNGTNIGYISISSFNQTTYQEFMDEMDYLLEDKEADGIVIDLRNNGGGDMNICLEMLDMILPDDIEPVSAKADESMMSATEAKAEAGTEEKTEGADENSKKSSEEAAQTDKRDVKIQNYKADGSEAEKEGTLLLSVESKNGDSARYYASDRFSADVPIVVVVNGSSASASEIFAGTLRDYGYQVVGTKTFGKGIVQSLYNLSDGSAVKFTTEQYRLAGGELIHGTGITPTIEVEFEAYDSVTEKTVNSADGSVQPDLMKDKQISAAVKELERQIYEAFQRQ